ncbi:hypothetical protein [Pseudomonas sp. 273]|uniref:hypothetical protein n=1 Tax=Pseudomonas sp. 273 TaxID=75692 RepID=UPI0023D85256|nr:hypothetical protein [Pseudomonas sp. 273]
MKPILNLIILILLPPAIAEASVCEDLKSVTNQASDGFSSWKGSYDSDMEEYTALQRLPGASECVIDGDEEFPSYTCRWILGSENEMLTSYRSLVSQVTNCTNLFSRKPIIRAMPYTSRTTRYFSYKNEETTSIEERSVEFRIKIRSKSMTNLRNQENKNLVSITIERK